MANRDATTRNEAQAIQSALTTVALQLEPFRTVRKSLFIGACPPELVGIATLHGHVDVVDPNVERTRVLHQLSPAARVVRTPLADALSRLEDRYDVVFSADPSDVAGRWSWPETFEVIQRISAPAETSVQLVRLCRSDLGQDATRSLSAPRHITECAEVPGLLDHSRALEPTGLDPDSAVVGYVPDNFTAAACASAVLAQPPGADVFTLDTAREIRARLVAAPLAAQASALIVGSSVERLPQTFLADAQAMTAVDWAALPTPSTKAPSGESMPASGFLTIALLRGEFEQAHRVAQAYLCATLEKAQAPQLGRCLVSEREDIVAVRGGPQASLDLLPPEGQIEQFCRDLFAAAGHVPGHRDASTLAADLLRPRQPRLS